MGYLKKYAKPALVAVVALFVGVLFTANWRAHRETQRRLDALASAVAARPAEPAHTASSPPKAEWAAAPVEPARLPPSLVIPASGTAPREPERVHTPAMPASPVAPATSAYVIEAPDVLVIEAVLRDPRTGQTERLPAQPIGGEYLVRPDGTISLGVWGTVSVAGLTTDKAIEAIRRKLSAFTQVNGNDARTDSLLVTLDVKASNSKVFYVITDFGSGEQVARLPILGSATVLDAIAGVPGLASEAGKYNIRLVRQGPSAGAQPQVLPVNWSAIIQRGDTTTNYQLLPGDRVYVTSGR